jgi:hypothetical protein
MNWKGFGRKRPWLNIGTVQPLRSRNSSVGIATGYGLDYRGVGVLIQLGSTPAVGSTQPTIQWVLGTLSPGVKRPGCEANRSPPASADVKKNVDLYIHSPIRLHGVVLN